jgi:hypothetical protein
MQINIIIEKNAKNEFGRCGFQIKNKNQKHLECYIPKVQSKATKEQVLNMHSAMKAIQYCKQHLSRLKYVKFCFTTNLPDTSIKEWQVMDEYINKIATKIGCRVEYTKA